MEKLDSAIMETLIMFQNISASSWMLMLMPAAQIPSAFHSETMGLLGSMAGLTSVEMDPVPSSSGHTVAKAGHRPTI